MGNNPKLQCLAKKNLDFLANPLIKWVFLATYWFWALKVLLPPWPPGSISVRLEASKKVKLVHVPQGAAKLQTVKVLVFEKIKSVHRWRSFQMTIWDIKRKVQFLKNEKSLTVCNFAAPWGIWSNTFLEASNLRLFWARCSQE